MKIRLKTTVSLENERIKMDYKFDKGTPLINVITELAFNLDEKGLDKLQSVIHAMLATVPKEKP